LTYKRFQDLEKAKEEFFKDKETREKEYMNELKDKVSFKIDELPNPQPADYPTFDKYGKMYDMKKQKSKKKSMIISIWFWNRRKNASR